MKRVCEKQESFLECGLLYKEVLVIAKKFTHDEYTDPHVLASQMCAEDIDCRDFVELM